MNNSIKYKRVEYWKAKGFISDDLDVDKKIELVNNLEFGASLIADKALFAGLSNLDFYHSIKLVLYPIIVYYTKINDSQKVFDMIIKFIDYCEKYLNLEYDLNVYDDDYRLCMDFINKN